MFTYMEHIEIAVCMFASPGAHAALRESSGDPGGAPQSQRGNPVIFTWEMGEVSKISWGFNMTKPSAIGISWD